MSRWRRPLRETSLALLVVLGLGSNGWAAELNVNASQLSCADRGAVMHQGKTLTAVQCGEYIVFSDYTMMKIPHGAIFLHFDDEFKFYTPKLDYLRKADLERRVFGGLE